MQPIVLHPKSTDELRLVKQFAKLMNIKTEPVKETAKARKKREALDSIAEGLVQIKLHEEGKIRLKTAQELLDEL